MLDRTRGARLLILTALGMLAGCSDGFLSDGTERVDFSISTSQQLFGRGGKATLDATLTVARHDVVITAKAEGTAGESNGDGKIDLTVRSGSDQIVVDAQTIEGQLDATFTVNGQLLATATGDPKAPVIRGEGGRDLTSDELHALGDRGHGRQLVQVRFGTAAAGGRVAAHRTWCWRLNAATRASGEVHPLE